ncbi:hypothetical protein M409DRAFT_22620 [Zasmidium cellare ATCC 36951]|uniref:Uncharacterized protein n=1 Tax=Zasmidium cellare ATCC 36951 TaxID=1080233 RepID=A0A6A6CJH1_ZASCE|nr:uncharacterized protein M409DRAFT_22620 [Zasmidium cellare ATCC 36951]KAF2167191.1 hypothetical protein M409DRAFT_22620 [Zasmidium cellare ATCC 36951]
MAFVSTCAALVLALAQTTFADDSSNNTCQSYGVDYENGGSYFQNINLNNTFTAFQQFSGCTNDTAHNVIVDPNGDQSECSESSMQPSNTDMLVTCSNWTSSTLYDGDWSLLIVSNNGNGTPIAYQRDFSLSVGQPQATVSTDGPTVTNTVSTTVTTTSTSTSIAAYTTTLVGGSSNSTSSETSSSPSTSSSYSGSSSYDSSSSYYSTDSASSTYSGSSSYYSTDSASSTYATSSSSYSSSTYYGSDSASSTYASSSSYSSDSYASGSSTSGSSSASLGVSVSIPIGGTTTGSDGTATVTSFSAVTSILTQSGSSCTASSSAPASASASPTATASKSWHYAPDPLAKIVPSILGTELDNLVAGLIGAVETVLDDLKPRATQLPASAKFRKAIIEGRAIDEELKRAFVKERAAFLHGADAIAKRHPDSETSTVYTGSTTYTTYSTTTYTETATAYATSTSTQLNLLGRDDSLATITTVIPTTIISTVCPTQ